MGSKALGRYTKSLQGFAQQMSELGRCQGGTVKVNEKWAWERRAEPEVKGDQGYRACGGVGLAVEPEFNCVAPLIGLRIPQPRDQIERSSPSKQMSCRFNMRSLTLDLLGAVTSLMRKNL